MEKEKQAREKSLVEKAKEKIVEKRRKRKIVRG